MEAILDAVMSGIITIVVAIIGLVAAKVGAYAKTKADAIKRDSNNSVRCEIAERVVMAVEQTFADATGPEKLTEATKIITQELTGRGVPFHEDQVRSLIEAAVYGLRNGYGADVRLQSQVRNITNRMGSSQK